MSGQHAPARREPRADRLRDAEDDAADQRAPERAEAADDHRLEGEEQPVGAAREREGRPDAEEDAGDGDDGQRQRHRERVEPAVVDPHQRRGLAVVGGGAEGPADRRAADEELQPDEQQNGHGEGQQREPADGDPAAQRQARRLEAARVQPPRVRREGLEQAVLDHDGQAERHEHGRQDAAPEQPVEHEPLQPVADHGHDRHDQPEREQRIDVQRLHGDDRDEGGQDAEVAVGEVDQAHDAEDQRQPGGEERVETAQQDALHDRVEPGHGSGPEVGRGDPLARRAGTARRAARQCPCGSSRRAGRRPGRGSRPARRRAASSPRPSRRSSTS